MVNNSGQDSEKALSIIEKHSKFKKKDIKPYFFSVLIISGIIIPCLILANWIELINVGMLLLIPILIISLQFRIKFSIITIFLTTLLYNFLFIPPLFSLSVLHIKDFATLIVFIIVSISIGLIAAITRMHCKTIEDREHFLTSLYLFSKEIMCAQNTHEISEKITKKISKEFQCEAIMLFPDKHNNLIIKEKQGISEFNEKEKEIAAWVYKNGLPSEKSPLLYKQESWHYLPLNFEGKTFGVLGFITLNPKKKLTIEQQILTEEIANTIAEYLGKKCL